MLQQLSKFIYFKLLGWSVTGEFPGYLDKFVIAVVPHTSWWDFLLGVLFREVLNEPINYIAKKSLFDGPFGWFFRRTGGAPVDRSKNNDVVKATAQVFKHRDKFRLALAPEGTRKKVDRLRSGFYYIAKEANVPIVLVGFDYGNKTIKISEPFAVTGDIQADFKYIEDFFKGLQGKVPQYSY